MVPDPTNAEVASYTLDELLFAVPYAFGLKKFAQRVSICLLEDVVRISMMFVNPLFQLNRLNIKQQHVRQPEQPWYLHAFVQFLLSSVAFVQHRLLLPRLSPGFAVDIRLPKVDANTSCPRLYPNK